MADNTTQPKLEEQIRAACRLRHYSLATERTYVRWYKQFVRWAGMKHPATLGGDRVEAWLSHLATELEVLRLAREHPGGLFVLYAPVALAKRVPEASHVNLRGEVVRTSSVARLLTIAGGPLDDDVPF